MGCTAAKPAATAQPVQVPAAAPVPGSLAKAAATSDVQIPAVADHRTHLFSRGESEVEELPPNLAEGAAVRDGSNNSVPAAAAVQEKKVPPARPARPEAILGQTVEQPVGGSESKAGSARLMVTLTGAESEELGGLGKDVEDVVVSEVSDDETPRAGGGAARRFAEGPEDREPATKVETESHEPVSRQAENAPVPVMGTEAASATVEERLNKVEAVIYPSAKAALSSKGLQKYAAELESRGIVEYKDLATLVEDMDDPFWTRMPPFPDRKKMRSLVEEVRVTYGFPPIAGASDSAAPSPAKAEDTAGAASESRPSDATMGEETAALASAAAAVASIAAAPSSPVAPASGPNDEEDAVPSTPPRQKTETPCDDYETDVYAADFGMCVCGHPKKAHQFAQMNKAPSYAQRQQVQSKQVTADKPKDGSVCSNYTLDVTASTFGMCVCGNPKAAHTAQNNGGVNRFKEMAKGSFNKNSPMTRQSSASSIEEKAPEPPVKKPVAPPKVPSRASPEQTTTAPEPVAVLTAQSSEGVLSAENQDEIVAAVTAQVSPPEESADVITESVAEQEQSIPPPADEPPMEDLPPPSEEPSETEEDTPMSPIVASVTEKTLKAADSDIL